MRPNIVRFYVYIIGSANESSIYIGVTDNLERRVAEHRSGAGSGFTSKYRCCNLLYYEYHNSINEAIYREKQLKKWSREKKETLIRTINPNRVDLLPRKE